MILNQPSAFVIQQLWKKWLRCNIGGLTCHSGAGIESGTGLNHSPIPLLFFLTVHKNWRSKAGSWPLQILTLLGHLWTHQGHFRLAVIARQAVITTQRSFSRQEQCNMYCRGLLWCFASLYPHRHHSNSEKPPRVSNLWQLKAWLYPCVFSTKQSL